jgi:hypothetical protein
MADKGNKSYDDKGMLGSYCTRDSQFPNPAGVKTFTGYGADKADLERGFCKPTIRELPAYDKVNYADRSTEPRLPDEEDEDSGVAGFLGFGAMRQDFEFREKERRAKGFLTRPKIPTDR